MTIEENALGPGHLVVATTLDDLAAVSQAQGRYAEAEALRGRAIRIWERTLGPEHPSLARRLEDQADLLRKLNREHEATELDTRAEAIRAKHAERQPAQ